MPTLYWKIAPLGKQHQSHFCFVTILRSILGCFWFVSLTRDLVNWWFPTLVVMMTMDLTNTCNTNNNTNNHKIYFYFILFFNLFLFMFCSLVQPHFTDERAFPDSLKDWPQFKTLLMVSVCVWVCGCVRWWWQRLDCSLINHSLRVCVWCIDTSASCRRAYVARTHVCGEAQVRAVDAVLFEEKRCRKRRRHWLFRCTQLINICVSFCSLVALFGACVVVETTNKILISNRKTAQKHTFLIKSLVVWLRVATAATVAGLLLIGLRLARQLLLELRGDVGHERALLRIDVETRLHQLYNNRRPVHTHTTTQSTTMSYTHATTKGRTSRSPAAIASS